MNAPGNTIAGKSSAPLPDTQVLRRLFQPESVAIIGASDKNPWSGLVALSLQKIGFSGITHLVNRRGTQALGRPTAISCRDIGPVDAAFIAVPAIALPDALEDMAAGGIRTGAVVTSGMGETGGAGAAAQAKLFTRAAELGLTLLGPNSLGFNNFVDRVCLSAIPIDTPVLPAPRVGLASQSGATCAMISAIAHRQNVSLTYAIATGNEAQIDLAQIIRFLVEDAATRSIAVFAETIRDPEGFASAARAAAAARKPIVMLKVGTGTLTAAVAQAHTGALVGDDRVFQVVCEALGVVRVTSFEDLVVTADLLAGTGPIDPSRGFALVSISGGACEVVADRGEALGIPFPQFGTAALAALSEVVADFGAANNPLDITGAAMSNPKIYSGAMRAIASDRAIGLLGVLAELPAEEGPSGAVAERALVEIAAGFEGLGVQGLVMQQTLKPVSAYGRALTGRHHLPTVTGGLDHGVRAIANLYRWSRGVAGAAMPAANPPAIRHDRPMDERATLAYLASCGIPVIPQRVAQARVDAISIATELGGPVVLKILSPDIQHKSDIGGVALNLQGQAAIGDAFERMISCVTAARPDARIEGVLVSPMRPPGLELFVGIARDPLWGLAIAVGLGGIWVEILGDTALAVLPVTAGQARKMLGGLKAARLLQGYRGGRAADLDRLAGVIADIGDAALALGEDLAALEINPLRVDGENVEALDALAVWTDK